jgi:hypothetical protein
VIRLLFLHPLESFDSGFKKQRQQFFGEPPVHMIWRESVLVENEFVDFPEADWFASITDFIKESWRMKGNATGIIAENAVTNCSSVAVSRSLSLGRSGQ